MCLTDFLFPDCRKVSAVVPVFKNVWERSTVKNYHSVSLLSVVNKIFVKIVNNSSVDHLKKWFQVFMVNYRSFGSCTGQNRIEFLTTLGLFEQWHLIYPRLLTGCGMLVYYINLNIMEFEVGRLALFRLFSVMDGLAWFCMRSLRNSIQLMLEFLKAPFFVQHFSYYTLMTLLMMLSLILLSTLMMLFSTVSLSRHLLCGNNQNWLLNLNLTNETLQTGAGSGLLNSVNSGAIVVKVMGLFLKKNHLTRGWDSLSLLNWIKALIVMFGLVLLAATWICQINYKNGCVGLLFLHLLSLLNI